MLPDIRAKRRRFSAAASASARLSQKVEAAMAPGPNEVSVRYAPDRGCHAVTGVEIFTLGCQGQCKKSRITAGFFG